ncbi:MAG: helix-turn-helix domain-containing protein [Bacteroidetes bacterium]|nr:helix-turn-helix domain-containing protein [Bacteroidota bacterium]
METVENIYHSDMKNDDICVNLYDKDLLEKFILCLLKDIKYSRSVKYYATRLAISTKKLNYITKKYFGKTAKVYIEERIIENSKKLLSDTPNTVKQISYSMGFTDPTNFNKFFKKHTSITPLMFRQQFIKEHFNHI